MSVLVGPVNQNLHPFLSVVVGPVGDEGHPFRLNTEVPVRREIGDHIVYGFATHWLYANLEIVPDEEITAIVLWDPGWMRTGVMGTAKNEIRQVWELSRAWDVPLIGVYSDWFSAWKVDTGIVGTLASLMFVDAAIVDPVGAAALRSAPPMKIQDPGDYRYRPIAEMERYLTYGRLPRVGGGMDVEIKPIEERSVDVAMVSTLHPQHVVFRPYYVQEARRICERHGWSFAVRERATIEEMEELYLDSKVVFNVALGSQPNCRVYEALACGALLVTDNYTQGMDDAQRWTFSSPSGVEAALSAALGMPERYYEYNQRRGLEWAREHSPEKTWARILDAATELAPRTDAARATRLEWEAEMNRAGLS